MNKKANLPSILRYNLAAWALKAFSLNSVTRRAYRLIGNRLKLGRHDSLSKTDLERGLFIVNTLKNSGLDLDENSSVLELGTGWTHFYAIFLRMFSDAPISMYDVQDNRLLDALKKRSLKLAAALPEHFADNANTILLRTSAIAAKISAASNFESLYQSLRMRYVLEPTGSLDGFASNSFDVIFSVDVMEHVERASLPNTITAMQRLLKPGGLSIHQIGLDDHLQHYAPGMPSKNYLRYDDLSWASQFDNRLQYINRLQIPEFQALFQSSGFELLSSHTETDANYLFGYNAAPQFQKFPQEDMRATRAFLVHRKPR